MDVQPRPAAATYLPVVAPASLRVAAPALETIGAPGADRSLPSDAPKAEVPAVPVAPLAAVGGPAVPTDTPASAPAQDALVRATLNQYAAAYNDLDADAAQRVWPRVNRPALTRAFDGLASQRVSLGDCRIDVSGATATAICAGTTTWAPKVGGGSRTETRRWTFDLARSGSAWQIVNARVQNR